MMAAAKKKPKKTSRKMVKLHGYPMTDKHAKFVRTYVTLSSGQSGPIDGGKEDVATHAARLTGYSPGTARIQAGRMLQNDTVKAAIDYMLLLLKQTEKMSVDRGMREYEQHRLEALAAGQIGAANAATTAKLKLAGILVERKTGDTLEGLAADINAGHQRLLDAGYDHGIIEGKFVEVEEDVDSSNAA